MNVWGGECLGGERLTIKISKLIWAKIGYARNANFARRRARELIFSAFHRDRNFMGVCQKNPQDPTMRCLPGNLLKTISPLKMPILKFAAKMD